jgi:NAD(P)-dependent dehydrogenase (short-subunit alcohol dehydrogenase family)
MKKSKSKSTPRARPLLVLITGASQGLGAALAAAYAKRHPGAKLALVARNARNLEAVAVRCEKLGADAHGFVCDVTDAEAVARLSAAIVKRFRRAPDIVLNNAGAFTPSPLADTTPELFDAMLAANLRSAYLVTRGQTGLPGCAAYTVAKHGLTGLAAGLRAETKGTGLRVIAVHPGAIATPIWAGSDVPKERLMTAASVAEAVVGLTALDANTVVETITLRPGAGDF